MEIIPKNTKKVNKNLTLLLKFLKIFLMEKEEKRYRIRPKRYLCLSPEEAVSTGISTGEQIIEEIKLVRDPGFGYMMYASIRELPESEVMKIPVEERDEFLFESRKEAMRFIKEKGTDKLHLYGVVETRMVDRREISYDEEPVHGVMDELKKFSNRGG